MDTYHLIEDWCGRLRISVRRRRISPVYPSFFPGRTFPGLFKFLFFLLLLFPLPLSSQSLPPWPQFGQDMHRRGLSPSGTIHTNVYLKWTFNMFDNADNPAVIGRNGTVYVCSKDSFVYAINGTSGQLQWKVRIQGGTRYSPALNSNGKILLVSGARTTAILYALDADTGTQLWTSAPGTCSYLMGLSTPDAFSTPLLIPDITGNGNDVLFAMAMYRSCNSNGFGTDVAMFDIQNGKYCATMQITSYPCQRSSSNGVTLETANLVPVWNNDRVVWNGFGTLHSVGGNGAPASNLYTNIGLTTGITAYQGTTYLMGDSTNGLRSRGSITWTYSAMGLVTAAAAVSNNDMVIVGDENGVLYGLSVLDGTLVWQYITSTSITSQAAITSTGKIYLQSTDKYLYAINSTTGTFLWKYFTGNRNSIMPVLSFDNTIVIPTADSSIISLIECPDGQAWNKDTFSCSTCPIGFYPLSPIGCTPAPPGSIAAYDGQSKPILCGPGTYSPVAGRQSCLLCPPGSFTSKEGSTACEDLCPSGTFSRESGGQNQSVCLPCVRGEFSGNTGATSCIQCPPGTYNENTGETVSTACLECPIGTYSGTPGATSKEACLPAPQGYYVDKPGTRQPIACPRGTYNSQIGSTSISNCTACLPGTYGLLTGQIECIPCPVGYYGINMEGAYNASVCQPCSAGTHQPLIGMVSSDACIPCSPGSYNPDPGRSRCDLCQKGTYSDSVGSVTVNDCIPCKNGTYNGIPGGTSSSCIACPPGTKGSGEGMFSILQCIDCPPGEYSSSGFECFPCPSGSYSSLPRSTVCNLCPRGTYGSFEGAKFLDNCTKCPSGTTTLVTGATARSDCLETVYVCPNGYQPKASKPKPAALSDCESFTCREPLIIGENGCIACGPGRTGPPVTGACRICNATETCPGNTIPLVTAATILQSMTYRRNTESSWVCERSPWIDEITEKNRNENRSTYDNGNDIPFLSTGTDATSSILPGHAQIVLIIACVVMSFAILGYISQLTNHRSEQRIQENSNVNEYSSIGRSTSTVTHRNLCLYIQRKIGMGLEFIDMFALAHKVDKGQPVIKNPTSLGGIFTLAGASTLAILAAILIGRRDLDNVLVQKALNVFDTATEESDTVVWATNTLTAFRSGIEIRIYSTGDPEKCLSPLTWSATGLAFGSFELSLVSLCHKETPSLISNVSYLQLSCPLCVLTARSSVSLTMDYSCQVFVLEANAIDADSRISTLRTSSANHDNSLAVLDSEDAVHYETESVRKNGPLTSVVWTITPLYSRYTDTINGKASKGYHFIDGTTTISRTYPNLINDDNHIRFFPGSSTVTIEIRLPLQAYYTSTTLLEKTTTLQLIASIFGLTTIFTLFGTALQQCETYISSSARSRLSKKDDGRNSLSFLTRIFSSFRGGTSGTKGKKPLHSSMKETFLPVPHTLSFAPVPMMNPLSIGSGGRSNLGTVTINTVSGTDEVSSSFYPPSRLTGSTGSSNSGTTASAIKMDTPCMNQGTNPFRGLYSSNNNISVFGNTLDSESIVPPEAETNGRREQYRYPSFRPVADDAEIRTAFSPTIVSSITTENELLVRTNKHTVETLPSVSHSTDNLSSVPYRIQHEEENSVKLNNLSSSVLPTGVLWLRHTDETGDVWFTRADGTGEAVWDVPDNAMVMDVTTDS